MLHQRLAHLTAVGMDEGKDTGMNAAFLDRGMDRFGHDLSGAGMGRVAFHNDWAARRQRRGGVAARGGEGQREVRRAKDRDRTDRALDHADVGAGHRLAVWEGTVNAPVQMRAFANVIGEETELPGCPPPLALKAGGGQAGFAGADLGDDLGTGLHLIRDGIKEICAALAAGRGVGPKGVLGGFAGLVHVGGGAALELVSFAGGGGIGEGFTTADPFACDQVLAVGVKCLAVSAHDQSLLVCCVKVGEGCAMVSTSASICRVSSQASPAMATNSIPLSK